MLVLSALRRTEFDDGGLLESTSIARDKLANGCCFRLTIWTQG